MINSKLRTAITCIIICIGQLKADVQPLKFALHTVNCFDKISITFSDISARCMTSMMLYAHAHVHVKLC